MKVTTIGAALVDIYFLSPDFLLERHQDKTYLCQAYGHKVEIADHEVTTGGAASNTAVAFARRGHDVSIIAELGQDSFAELIKADLARENVNLDYLIPSDEGKTGCSVILRGADGGRTIMVSRSASGMLDDYDIPVDYLATRDWLHLSSVGGNLNALSELWQVFDLVKNLGFSWNPGQKELKALVQGSLALPPVAKGVFFVNDGEWEQIAVRQADVLHTFPYVVITAGKNPGTVYFQGEKVRDIIPDGTPATEETGAGDAFASAFASTLLYERSLDEAITAALNNASSVIKFTGAKKGLLTF